MPPTTHGVFVRSSCQSVFEATVRNDLAVAFYSNPIQTGVGSLTYYVERCNSGFETALSLGDRTEIYKVSLQSDEVVV